MRGLYQPPKLQGNLKPWRVVLGPLDGDHLHPSPHPHGQPSVLPHLLWLHQGWESLISLNQSNLLTSVEDHASVEAHWSMSLVGYVVGKVHVFSPFVAFHTKKWKPKGHFTLSIKGNDFFICNFDSEDDLTQVLEGGP
ncbi:hypothetical protein QJS10_CPA09g00993 [Acorus calamus]|uniref:DUF4283 domain-containing protein n=1 Tax=Acorus calamus TaxID=4465 RepID=A0AAV9E6X9_ACOCL|nr:hypothetical protein QJS10_CPA09g00993 [Acorus calamus]